MGIGSDETQTIMGACMSESHTYTYPTFTTFDGKCTCGHSMGAHQNPGGACGYKDCLCVSYRDGRPNFELIEADEPWPWYWPMSAGVVIGIMIGHAMDLMFGCQ